MSHVVQAGRWIDLEFNAANSVRGNTLQHDHHTSNTNNELNR